MKIEREKDETEVRGENELDTAEIHKRLITVIVSHSVQDARKGFFFMWPTTIKYIKSDFLLNLDLEMPINC